MDECEVKAGFPLTLPAGTSATPLPWEKSETKECGDVGHEGSDDDRSWVVRATDTDGRSSSTWVFGKPDFGRHLCLHRFKLWWLRPSHGNAGLDVPLETTLLVAECSSAPAGALEFAVLLPISDTYARATLHRAGGAGGTDSAEDPAALALSADTGDDGVLLPKILEILLVATGQDPFRLARRVVGEATKRLKDQLGLARVSEGYAQPVKAAGFADTFGWCTWDSFYTMVTPEGILDGLSGFRARGVHPRWVVIDDGWQRTTNDDALNTEQWDERLVGLEANKRFRRFDEKGEKVLDLGDTVRKMKADFGVETVLAWHALTGYWAGVEPDAEEITEFQPFVTKLVAPDGIKQVDPEMQPELDDKRFGMVPAARVEDFFRAYHTYLKENGVSGVKVDAQSILDCMGGGNGGVPAVTRAYHQALTNSVQSTFQEGDKPASLIHCMCHAPSVLFHIAAVSQDRVVIRGSDDFYPREDSSHGPHLYTNAYNALLLSNLGIQDWDMFQSSLGCQGEDGVSSEESPDNVNVDVTKDAATTGSKVSYFHAAARAISGGPVYVSDRLGQHNTVILNKLVLEDGSVLRAKTNALPTLDCLMRDPQLAGGGLLQIWALNALPGTGVVGSFNVRGAAFSQSERTWVRLEDVDVPAVNGNVSPADVHAFAGKPPQTGTSHVEIRQKTVGKNARQHVLSNVVETAGHSEQLYAVYMHCRKELRVVRFHETIPVEILPLSFELATFSRVVELCGLDSGDAAVSRDTGSVAEVVHWAVIGLADMLNSSAAVTQQEVVRPSDEGDLEGTKGRTSSDLSVGVALSVKGSGRFLALTNRRPNGVTLESGGVAKGEGRVVCSIDVSFSPLPVDGSGGADPSGAGADTGHMRMIEVTIPGPWDGKERRLEFVWD